MIRKEIWHGMRAYKATFFIKGYRQRAVAGSHLQYRKLSAVFFNKKFNQRFGIAFSLKWGTCSDILNFKYSIPFVRYDTLAFHSVIIKNIHFTFIEITVNHIFLLIRQQEQIKILFFVFCNFYNSHRSHLQIQVCRNHSTIMQTLKQEKSTVIFIKITVDLWWRRRDSNSRPLGCEPNALPAELRPHSANVIITHISDL